MREEFAIADTVYVKTDRDQDPGMVVAITRTPKDMEYHINRNGILSTHYNFELSYDKNYSNGI